MGNFIASFVKTMVCVYLDLFLIVYLYF